MTQHLATLEVELTEVEQGRLVELETVIDRGQKVFVEVGLALAEIRDNRLYRETHRTFEDYCQERWGFTRMRASQLIAAAETVGNLNVNNCLQIPSTESQARPLAGLEPEVQRAVWEKAVETAPNGKVTAAHVEQTKNGHLNAGGGWDDAPLRFGPVGSYRILRDAKRCEKCNQVWMADIEYCPYCNLSSEMRTHLAEKAEKVARLPLAAANHSASDTPGYDGDEWYTPSEIVNAARRTMGEIDLDPATCHQAQQIIQARKFYTKADDSLRDGCDWHGRVWLNPPYSMPLIKQFVSKLIEQYDLGHAVEAIIITNNSSDTTWFHSLLERFPACFTFGRVRFWLPDHEDFGARQGQTIFYLGKDVQKFCDEFAEIGRVVVSL